MDHGRPRRAVPAPARARRAAASLSGDAQGAGLTPDTQLMAALRKILSMLPFAASAPIGGQAVLEGVMMRSPSAWSVAVRKPDGEIAEVNRPVVAFSMRHKWARIPVIRGIVALGESLTIGFRALAISANYAAQEEGEDGEEVQTELTRGQLIFAFAVAIGFALLLFKVSPALITNWLPIEGNYSFVIVEGLIRVALFIVYLLLISMLPDLKRVFQYHAAEHKAINALEDGAELEPETVQKLQPHPRALRDGVPALRDGDRDLRLRVLRAARLAVADRHAHPAPPGHRRARLRGDPLRRASTRTTRFSARSWRRVSGSSASRPASRASTRSRSPSARSVRSCASRASMTPEERKVEVMA